METSHIEHLLERILADEECLTKIEQGLQNEEPKHFVLRYGEDHLTQGELTKLNSYTLQIIRKQTPNPAESIHAYSQVYQESLNQACESCTYAAEEQGIILFRLRENILSQETARNFARTTGLHPSVLRELGNTSEYILLNLLQRRGKNQA